jgi:hypothetical protein
MQAPACVAQIGFREGGAAADAQHAAFGAHWAGLRPQLFQPRLIHGPASIRQSLFASFS